MCAFNLPAVALTLGRDQWPQLRDYYLTLCRDKVDKVRQSLASSMHEIANIIGPQQAADDLLEPFSMFLRDHDLIQTAMIENISVLLPAFAPQVFRQAVRCVSEAWLDLRVWRLRESLAHDLVLVAPHCILAGATEDLLSILGKAFKDSVAAVREQAVLVVSTFLL
jgi:hypothetical protein